MSTILVVDDEQAILDAIAILLADEGHTVHTVRSGAAALEYLQRGRAELIVSDIMMPGIDGHALVRKLRERDETTPVLLMSAAFNPTSAVPNVRCLRKPFDIDEFLRAVQEGLKQDFDSSGPPHVPVAHRDYQDHPS